MYEIEVYGKRQARPFWQKPITMLYIGLIPAVVGVNYAWDRAVDVLHKLERSAALVVELSKEVDTLKAQVAAQGEQIVRTEPVVLEPTPVEDEEPATARPAAVVSARKPGVTPAPMNLYTPPVPVITRNTTRTPVPEPARQLIADATPTASKSDAIPEAGKFTLIADEPSGATAKPTFKLQGER
jgi:hypothetical protein